MPPNRLPTKGRVRLVLSPAAMMTIVGATAGVALVVALGSASVRVLGWMAAAVSLAALIHPIVRTFARKMPRAVALLLTAVLILGGGSLIVYGTVDGVLREARILRVAAPRRAAELERSKRFGDAARSVHLADRTKVAVDEIPRRLRGGSASDALRSAATRGVAFLATGVLTMFMLLHGRRILFSALDQISDDARRATTTRIVVAAYHRGIRYAGGSVAMALAAGGFTALLARITDVPGAVPLGLWAALWDLVPMLGAVIGALPVVLLAAASSPGLALGLFSAFTLYQVFEAIMIQRRLERRSVRLGPFLTLLVGSVGLELYGLGGALVALLVGGVLIAALDEWEHPSSLAPET